MQSHDHKHDESHHHHSIPQNEDDERRVFWAMLLVGGFMLIEAAGGWWSGSLALLADAGHMLTDFVALALAWFAFRMTRKSADERRTYGYHRVQVLAAFVNGLLLFLVALYICIEAVKRLRSPNEILSGWMLAVAIVGLLVNVLVFKILHGGNQENLNIRGAVLHVVGDMLGSVAAIAAALIIMWTGWLPIDAILSVLVTLLILYAAWKLVKKTSHILLEGSPEGLDPDQVKLKIVESVPGVTDVHHFHAWLLTNELPVITMHASIDEHADADKALIAIHDVLEESFGLAHATIQIERGMCPDAVPQP